MLVRIFTAISLIVTLAVFNTHGVAIAQSAHFRVLTNGAIYTVDADRTWADTIAIDPNGIIVAVGNRAEVLANIEGEAEIIDLGGRMVLPGFQDVHLHALEAGVNEQMCLFEPEAPLDVLLSTLRQCADQTPAGRWIIGTGVNMTALLEQVENPLAAVDAVVSNRPVLILDDLGHGALANTAALASVGYDTMEGDPPGGLILRDEASGRPNGVVLENAQQKLRNAAFAPTPENLDLAYESLVNAQGTLSSNGITSVSDAGGYWPQQHPEIWLQAEKNADLTVRASNALYLYPDRPFNAQLEDLKRRFSSNRDALVRFDQIKIYIDGILSQATSAMYQPYEADLGLASSDRLGFEYFDTETLHRYTRALTDAGFQLHFHATGDRGAGLALDAIETTDPSTGPHRITHLYQVAASDMPRFESLGVVADFQMAPSSIDAENKAFMANFIGERSADLLPIDALLAAGASVTLSSDWDADSLSPVEKIQTVLTRDAVDSEIDLARAIEMLTIEPARLLRHDETTGSLEPGKFADLVILEHNLFELPSERIGDAGVVATLLQGEPVYDPGRMFQ